MRILFVFSYIIFLSFTIQSQTKIDSLDYSFGGGATGSQSLTRFNRKSISQGKGLIIEKFTEYKKMKKNNWNKIVNHANFLMSKKFKYFYPGDINYFITIYYNGTKKTICWAPEDQNVPTSIRKLNSLLLKIQ